VSKIESLVVIPIAYEEPNDFNAVRHAVLVKATATSGAIGWGEAVTMWPEASLATVCLVDAMAELIVGTDVLHVGRAHALLSDHVWWYGYGGGVASFAISAIDIALWDLKGRELGVSVTDLLGGPVVDRLPAWASCHAHHEEIPQMVDEALGWLASGQHGLKVGFGKRGNANLGFDEARDIEYVKQMREGIGPDRGLAIDCGWAVKWDVTEAVRRAQAFDHYDVTWFEEPLGAWDHEGYRNLRAKTLTRIAYGEKEFELKGYQRVLDTETVDVVGIDPARVGGLTSAVRIAQEVATRGRQPNAHAWSTAITTAASLAMSFAVPGFKLLESKPLGSPVQDELVNEPISHVGGWHRPLPGPGLGIEVDESVVERYRLKR
jgi:L-alanine-DL-glutamate epimerase-like enolase superfamily enzyme